ncbi:MAG: DegV family protein [Clostridia bacterium]|nr:DegV family protein [Clostridia bacterium]
MSQYVITCCSTVDVSEEKLKALDVPYVPFHYFLDAVEFEDDLYTSLSPSSFYRALLEGAEPKTAQVNTDEFTAFFKRFLDAGIDVLHLSFSTGLSGSCQSARVAAEDLKAAYPERRIEVVDTLAASSGYGLLVSMAAEMRLDGDSLDTVKAFVEENKLKIHHWFFSTDLSFYVKGGRLSRMSGWFGTVLKICPLLNMDKDGHLTARYKLRGKKRVIEAMVDKFKECVENGENYGGKCYISHSDCYEDARAVADAVEQFVPALKGKVEIFNIGPTIGCHTGPGTVALFFVGSERID